MEWRRGWGGIEGVVSMKVRLVDVDSKILIWP